MIGRAASFLVIEDSSPPDFPLTHSLLLSTCTMDVELRYTGTFGPGVHPIPRPRRSRPDPPARRSRRRCSQLKFSGHDEDLASRIIVYARLNRSRIPENRWPTIAFTRPHQPCPGRNRRAKALHARAPIRDLSPARTLQARVPVPRAAVHRYIGKLPEFLENAEDAAIRMSHAEPRVQTILMPGPRKPSSRKSVWRTAACHARPPITVIPNIGTAYPSRYCTAVFHTPASPCRR
ncbi:hypothetical protein K438DRAFT_170796 [Mycena galopus ATCC 62051]|nr:hypothetical protein K438DRAFT_170796 [Mycena galopus ATCC 62051]